ncbi:MAG: hypothetical protein LBV52_06450, partial [Spirochaetaceae bacterium]|nr:hypothetical protein [Spirochaetaceae bacterium]
MREYIKLKYPLIFKLFVVITLTLFAALGVIIYLSYFFIHNSIKDTQEMNNRLLNNSAAAFVTSSFNDVYTDAEYLMKFIQNTNYVIDWNLIGNIAAMCILKKSPSYTDNSAPKQSAPRPVKANDLLPFFTVEFDYQKWEFDNLFINDSFFEKNNYDSASLMSFFSGTDIYREAQTNIVIFAAQNFDDFLVMRIANNDSLYFVFLSAENISNSFSSGANTSILFDDLGNPLIVSNDNDYRNGKVSAGRRLYNDLQFRKIKTGEYNYGAKKGFFAIQNISIKGSGNSSG